MQTASLPQTVSQTKSSLLRRALLGDAAFSGLSGLFLALDAQPIAAFLGVENALTVTMTGIVLIIYAPFLLWMANRNPIPRALVWAAIDLDILWIIGSAVLIFSNLLPLTIAGKWAIAIVADGVTVFAILKYLGLRRQ